VKHRSSTITSAVATAALTIVAAFGIAAPAFAVGPNVMNANVKPGPAGGGVNGVYGHITVCIPGTSTCQVVGNLLIDTGSFGLRIFRSALSIKLPSLTSGGETVAECAFFDSATAWGRVGLADVTLAAEPAISNLPVQIINPAFPAPGDRPAACDRGGAPLARTPQQENFNGILGVGLLQYDGGFTDYYACTASSCGPIAAPPAAQQVQNPVPLLPVDHNGVMLSMPAISSGGSPPLTGRLVLGINTRLNNQVPAGYKAFTANPSTLTFTTDFGGTILPGIIDSGSNGYFFHDAGLALCSGAPPSWYCPAALTELSAITTGWDGVNSKTKFFFINNAYGLFLTGNSAFSDLGADLGAGSGFFDWGLPFFFGRQIFVGIAGQSIVGVSEPTPLWIYK